VVIESACISVAHLTLVIGTGEMIHGQLLRMGEKIFGDPATGVQYFMLRADPAKPDCNPNADIEAEIQKKPQYRVVSTMMNIDSLFADEVVDPEAIRQSLMTAKTSVKTNSPPMKA
jgi:hypothetical protein